MRRHLSPPSRFLFAALFLLPFSCPSGIMQAPSAPPQPHTWAQAHEQKVECSVDSHVSRLSVSSSWAGIPGAGGYAASGVVGTSRRRGS